MLSSYEENTLRNILGGEEENQPDEILKNFGKEFTKLKIQNHRTFDFEKQVSEDTENVLVAGEESVHYNERGRPFSRSPRFVRSKSNPRFFRQARSQSWNNARSNSRSRPSQRYQRVSGTPYWNNKDDDKKFEKKGEEKLDQILKNVKRVAENYEELSKKVNMIEDKMKSVNYCEEEVREVHFTERDKVDHEIIIDSGCPKTLASEKIVLSYVEKHNLDLSRLKKKPCAMMFKFGDSRYPSHEIVELPVKLPVKSSDGAKESFVATIETYVVKGDVPFLLGDNTMMDWLSKIDVADRVLEVHKYKDDKGKPVFLNAPLKGSHMKIEMQDLKEKSLEESVQFMEQQVLTGEVLTDFKSVRKIHERLNHKSKENLIHAYANADLLPKELKETIKKVVDQCKVCQKFRKSMPRPLTTLPKCNDFNQIITLDLKLWKTVYILWMVCSFTRFIKGVVIPNKEAETVVDAVIKNWNCNFGIPSTGYWCDNGTEFKNAEMSEFCNKSGLSIKFGPAYSPWANGINERNHASADKIIAKIMEDDKKITLSAAVALAGWCHNTNVNKLGYSPMQLVTGKSVVFPGLTTGNMSTDSAFDSEYVQRIMSRHIKMMGEFQIAEYNDKLQSVLKKNGKSWQHVKYKQGDLVYVQFQNKKSWSGPVKVFAQDGADVWIFHNGNLMKLATCRVVPVVEPSELDVDGNLKSEHIDDDGAI